MAVDYIRYDILAQEALRGVVRTVLRDAAANGLPGEHHLYVTFDTRTEGVRLSDRLHEQYPEDMTIVLQHQFWDLIVTDDAFEVGLSFNGIPERLFVPFAAIKGFLDPSVQFGMQFETLPELVGDVGEPRATGPAMTAAKTGARPPAPHARQPQPGQGKPPVAANPAPERPPAIANAPEPTDRPPGGGGDVVRLDRFRKK